MNVCGPTCTDVCEQRKEPESSITEVSASSAELDASDSRFLENISGKQVTYCLGHMQLGGRGSLKTTLIRECRGNGFD